MNELLRTTAAGAAGAVVATIVLAGAPALADELKAKKITSAMIKNGTIKRADLNADVNASLVKADSALQGVADGSVVTVKLADGSVTTAKLVDGAVTGAKLANGSVITVALADGSVTSAKVVDQSLTSSDLAADSVDSEELAPNSVTNEELGSSSVGASQLQGDSVDNGNIQNNSLHVDDIALSSGTKTWDFPSIAPGGCSATNGISGEIGTLNGALILVQNAPTVAGSIYLMGRQIGTSLDFAILACNTGTAAFDPPSASFAWAILS